MSGNYRSPVVIFSADYCAAFVLVIGGYSKSTYALREREGVRVKSNVYCFYDVILLFENEQGGRRVLKSPNLSVRNF